MNEILHQKNIRMTKHNFIDSYRQQKAYRTDPNNTQY